MEMIFLIWGMILVTIFLVSDTIEDFLDSRERRKRRRHSWDDDIWKLKE